MALGPVVGAMLISVGAAWAQGPAAAPPAQAASAAAKKPDLGAWWQKNALEYSPLPAQWLFHAEGSFSYMNASGNTSGSTVDASATAEIRKKRFTSTSFAQTSRKAVTYGFGQGSVDFIERTLRQQVDVAFAPRAKFVAGIEAYRNTLMFMDKRINVYGGVGATLVREKKHQVTFTGALGWADFDFDRNRMLYVNPGQVGLLNTSPSSGGAMAMETWRWNVSPRFTFSQDGSYMKYFDSYLGRRWTLNLNGNIPIDKHLSFTVTYRIREETNTIIEALRVKPQGPNVPDGHPGVDLTGGPQ